MRCSWCNIITLLVIITTTLAAQQQQQQQQQPQHEQKQQKNEAQIKSKHAAHISSIVAKAREQNARQARLIANGPSRRQAVSYSSSIIHHTAGGENTAQSSINVNLGPAPDAKTSKKKIVQSSKPLSSLLQHPAYHHQPTQKSLQDYSQQTQVQKPMVQAVPSQQINQKGHGQPNGNGLYNVGYSINFLQHNPPKASNQHLTSSTSTKLGSASAVSKRQRLENAEIITGHNKAKVERPTAAYELNPQEFVTTALHQQQNNDLFQKEKPKIVKIPINTSSNLIPVAQKFAVSTDLQGSQQDLRNVEPKASETLQTYWKNLSPTVEIYHSDGGIHTYSRTLPEPQVITVHKEKFDHAGALGNSQGFDYSNAIDLTNSAAQAVAAAQKPATVATSHQNTILVQTQDSASKELGAFYNLFAQPTPTYSKTTSGESTSSKFQTPFLIQNVQSIQNLVDSSTSNSDKKTQSQKQESQSPQYAKLFATGAFPTPIQVDARLLGTPTVMDFNPIDLVTPPTLALPVEARYLSQASPQTNSQYLNIIPNSQANPTNTFYILNPTPATLAQYPSPTPNIAASMFTNGGPATSYVQTQLQHATQIIPQQVPFRNSIPTSSYGSTSQTHYSGSPSALYTSTNQYSSPSSSHYSISSPSHYTSTSSSHFLKQPQQVSSYLPVNDYRDSVPPSPFTSKTSNEVINNDGYSSALRQPRYQEDARTAYSNKVATPFADEYSIERDLKPPPMVIYHKHFRF